MARRDREGIADDAALYEEFAEPVAADASPVSPPRGIADDAHEFEEILDESTDAARTLDSNWIYQLEGRIFGPLKPRELLELLYSGEISKDTLLAPEETGELQPLSRYGVFRVHLPKAEKHRQEREAALLHEKAEASARLWRRVGFVIAAVVMLGLASAGVAYWIRTQKLSAAALEKARREAVLKKELDELLASVTIQPPLLPLVEDEPVAEDGDVEKGSKKSLSKPGRRARGVARLTGSGELTNEEVMSGVARAFGGFKRCIVTQIQSDSESVPSEIVLTFAIGNDGVPKDFSLANRSLRKAPISDCMARQLAQVRWRAFKGEVRNVEYPITISR